MTLLTGWLTSFRFLFVVLLIAGTTSTAYALQDGGLKGDQPADDDDAPGLIEEGLYESPQFGVEVSWTDAWEVGSLSNPDVEHAIGGQFDGPVASDGDLGDIIFLVDTASESSVLSIGFSPASDIMDPDVLMTAMQDPSFLTDNLYLSEDAEIVLIDTDDEHVAVVAREAAPNDEHVVYMMITADPGRDDFSFWVGLDMYDATEYDAVLTSLQDDIDVDGLDPLPVFDADEIVDALEGGAEPATEESTEVPATEVPATETPDVTEEPATETPDPTEAPATETPESTETPVIVPPGTEEGGTPGPFVPDGTPIASPVASPVTNDLPGLVAEGRFESPIRGIPVTWSTDWVLDEREAPAIRSFPESGVEEIFLARTGVPEVTAYLSIEPSYGVTDTGELLTALTEPSFFSRLDLPEDTEVALTREQTGRVAVMYIAAEADTTTVVILEAHVLDDDTVLYIELRGPATSIDESLLDLTEDTIEAAGVDAMDILDGEEVVAAIP
jgi:hypothetical protein